MKILTYNTSVRIPGNIVYIQGVWFKCLQKQKFLAINLTTAYKFWLFTFFSVLKSINKPCRNITINDNSINNKPMGTLNI